MQKIFLIQVVLHNFTLRETYSNRVTNFLVKVRNFQALVFASLLVKFYELISKYVSTNKVAVKHAATRIARQLKKHYQQCESMK